MIVGPMHCLLTTAYAIVPISPTTLCPYSHMRTAITNIITDPTYTGLT